jgi:hypothetical protein
MRSLKTLIVAAGLAVLHGLALAQTPTGGTTTAKPPPAKSALELALEAAFQNNPDLRVALARLNEAEAELARARLQVAQKVVTAFRAVEKADAAVQAAEQHLQEVRAKAARLDVPAVRAAERSLAEAKSKQAAAQADLDYLLGKPAAKEKADTDTARALYAYNLALAQHAWLRYQRDPTAERGPAADRIRKALDGRMSLKYRDAPARQVLEDVQKAAPTLHIQAAVKGAPWDEKVTTSLTDVPLSAALQLLEDVVGHRVVVRGYGLLIVPADRVPPGAVLLGDFLKSRPDATATPRP